MESILIGKKTESQCGKKFPSTKAGDCMTFYADESLNDNGTRKICNRLGARPHAPPHAAPVAGKLMVRSFCCLF